MKDYRIFAMCILVAVGCTSSTNDKNESTAASKEKHTRPPLAADPELWPARLTTRFGMTFQLVRVDTSRPDHKESFPEKPYYLQLTELTSKQNEAFQRTAEERGVFEPGPRRSVATQLVQPYVAMHRGQPPSEWSEAFWYAKALSLLDSDFDYRLPSRAEWTFACMSGYEQRCDGDTPNAFGFTGMHDSHRGDAEAIDERWGERGKSRVLMGYWSNNWRCHEGETKPDCPCEYWTVCAPDGDDSLNEVITARFVLMPKKIVEGTGK